MPKKYTVIIVVAVICIFSLSSILYTNTAIKLVDYNLSEDPSYKLLFKTEGDTGVLSITGSGGTSKVGQFEPVYVDSPVSYILLETKSGRYIVSKVSNNDPKVKLDTVFYQRPIIHSGDDSMNTIKASYIYNGYAVTPILPSEYKDWETVESVGVTTKGSGGIIYDQKVYLPLYYNIYRIAN